MRGDVNEQQLRIRVLEDGDAAEIRRVAERDSSATPKLPLLGAEVEGRLVAAVRLDDVDGEAIADPFVPTQEAVAMLRMRAGQLRGVDAGDRPGQLRSSGAIVRPAEASCSQ